MQDGDVRAATPIRERGPSAVHAASDFARRASNDSEPTREILRKVVWCVGVIGDDAQF
jgi:hypothetical protein